MFGAACAGGSSLDGEAVSGAGLAGRGPGGRAEPAGSAGETLGCVGDTWTPRHSLISPAELRLNFV